MRFSTEARPCKILFDRDEDEDEHAQLDDVILRVFVNGELISRSANADAQAKGVTGEGWLYLVGNRTTYDYRELNVGSWTNVPARQRTRSAIPEGHFHRHPDDSKVEMNGAAAEALASRTLRSRMTM